MSQPETVTEPAEPKYPSGLGSIVASAMESFYDEVDRYARSLGATDEQTERAISDWAGWDAADGYREWIAEGNA